jgi:hypothetical protein
VRTGGRTGGVPEPLYLGSSPHQKTRRKLDALSDFAVGPGYDKAYRAFQSVFCREASAQPREGCKIQGAVQDK